MSIKMKFKKFFAALLCIVLCFEMLPIAGFSKYVAAAESAGSENVVFADFEDVLPFSGADNGNYVTHDLSGMPAGMTQVLKYARNDGNGVWNVDILPSLEAVSSIQYAANLVSPGAVAVSSAYSSSPVIDISVIAANGGKIVVNVLDTQGNNSLELRLTDANGGTKENWTSDATKDQWTTLALELSSFSDNVDFTQITKVSLWELNQGDYYIGEIYFTDSDGNKVLEYQDFEDCVALNNVNENKLVSTEKHSGNKSLLYDRSTVGGDVVIKSGTTTGVDATGMEYMVLWIKDTQGSNTFELRLTDANGGTSKSGYYTRDDNTGKSIHNEWTPIVVQMSDLLSEDGSGLDVSKISKVKIWEWNAGLYYIDDIYFTNTVLPQPPTSSKASGNFTSSFDLTLNNPNSDGEIYYTINEDTPTAASTHYTTGSTISITDTTEVKAVVINNMGSSSVLTLNFTFIPADTPVNLPFQDFESPAAIIANGSRVTTQPHLGTASAKYTVYSSAEPQKDNSFYTESAEPVDISLYSYLVFWMKDPIGSNTVKLQLTDTSGNESFFWWQNTIATSDGKSFQNEWTPYVVEISNLNDINNIDKTAVKGIRIGQWNAADYYIDDIYFTNVKPPAPPKASHTSSVFSESFNLTLTNPNSDGIIYYTTDGTAPTASSTEYKTPLSISTTTEIKAAVINDLYTSQLLSLNFTLLTSDIPTKAYLQDFEATPPVLKNGEIVTDQFYYGTASALYTVAVSADPDANSSFYTESSTPVDASAYTYLVFWLKDTQGVNTVKLQLTDASNKQTSSFWAEPKSVKNEWVEYAVKIDNISGIANIDKTKIKGVRIGQWNSGKYYIDDIYFTNNLLPKTPVSNFASGTYDEALNNVTLTSDANCDIYYTTDGSQPSKNSTKYTEPFAINSDTTLKAVAYNSSADEYGLVSVFSYRIKPLPTSGTVMFNTLENTNNVHATTGAEASVNTTEKNNGKNTVSYKMATINGVPEPSMRSISITTDSNGYGSVDARLSKYLVFDIKDMQGCNNTRMWIQDAFGNVASGWTTCNTKHNEWSQYFVDLSTLDGYQNLDLAYISQVTFGFYNTGLYILSNMRFTDHLKDIQTPSANTVSASYPSGTYNIFLPVELAAETGATIYYTTNGSDPTANSSKYNNAIYLENNATIKAIAVKDTTTSNVFTFNYVIKPAKPFATNGLPGDYDKPVIVTLRSSKDNTPVFYTLDGTEPTLNSTRYNSPFKIEESTTVKAIAYNGIQSSNTSDRVPSDVSSLVYNISNTQSGIAKPVASIPEGTLGAAATVTLSCKTTDAKIYYTTDGTTPTAQSTLYSGGITVSASMLLQAIAIKEGVSSDIARYQYTFNTNPTNFLKTNGKQVKNNYGSGDTVVLRGTNAGGWLVTENWQCPVDAVDYVTMFNAFKARFGEDIARELINYYQDYWWTITDFDLVKAEGINMLRLPVAYFEMINDDGSIKQTAFDRLDWFIYQCKIRDIYVMIDMHGAVGSQNGKDHSGDTTIADIGNFYGNTEAIQKTIKLWEAIAERYKNEPMVCGYDLLNEPSATSITQFEVYDQIYDAIRTIDKDHIIYIQGIWNPTDLPSPDLYGWENVVYQYHFYMWDDLNNSAKQVNFINEKISMVNESTNFNVPVYIGEFTFFNNLDSWNECLKLFEQEGWSYTTWTWKVTDGGEGSSWGLYTAKNNPVFVNSDSIETIKDKWSRLQTDVDFTRNDRFANTLKEYFSKNIPINVPYSAQNEVPANTTILANSSDNSSEAALTAYVNSQAAAAMSYGNSSLIGKWELQSPVWNIKGGNYTYKNSTNNTFINVQVVPINATIQTVPNITLTAKSSGYTTAEALKLPSSVTVRFTTSSAFVAPSELVLPITWSDVPSTNFGKTGPVSHLFTGTIKPEDFPAWATVANNTILVTVNIKTRQKDNTNNNTDTGKNDTDNKDTKKNTDTKNTNSAEILLVELESAITVNGVVDKSSLEIVISENILTIEAEPTVDGIVDVVIPAELLLSIKNKAQNQDTPFVFEVTTSYCTYQIPVDLADMIQGFSDILKLNNLDADAVSFKITMTDMSNDTATKSALKSVGGLLGTPVDFSIDVVDKNTNEKIATVNTFTSYVERTIAIPEELEQMPAFYSAARLNTAENRWEFVPHSFKNINGSRFISIRSMTNSTYAVFENHPTFEDVIDGFWGTKFIEQAASKLLVSAQGTGGGFFNPDSLATRAQLIQVIVNALQLPNVHPDTIEYSDVPKDHWSYNAIMKAKSAGLLKDMFSSDIFLPNKPITREEMAGILAVVAKYANITTSNAVSIAEKFSDYDQIDSKYADMVSKIVNLKIMHGTSQNTFSPKSNATRAQLATVVINMLSAFGMID